MGDMPPPFIKLPSGGGGGGGGGRKIGGPMPPPPPPPPGGAGGGPPPPPPPQRVNPNQGQGQPMMMPPANMPHPPQSAIPVRLQIPRVADISDIRREKMTDKEVREALSDYQAVRFERIADDDGYDSSNKSKSSWQQCYRTLIQDVSKADIVREIRILNKQTMPVTEKKRTLNPDQQRQIEKQLDEIAIGDRDPRFQWELAQIDHQLRRLEDKHHKKYGHIRSRSKSRDRHSRRNSLYRSKSRDAHSRKRFYQRISLTAYYKRCPKADAPIHVMLRERDMFMNMPPPHHQQMLNMQQQQMLQQQQRQQQGQGQGQGQGQQRPFMPGGNKGGGMMKGGGGGGKSPKALAMSDSESDSEGSCSDDMWSSTNGSRSSRTSDSYPRRRRGRKDRRFLEHGPTHFGIKPHAPIRRHSRHEDNYTFESSSPRLPPLAPAPPRARLLPAEEIERAYAEGKADGRVEERIEAHAADSAAAAAYRPRLAPPPRVIQSGQARNGVRIVRYDDLDDDLHLDRLRLDDRVYDDRRLDDLRYADEVDDWPPRRRRTIGRILRDDDAIIVEEQMRDERDRHRHREAMDYMSRRESSPGVSPFTNPFTPRLARRNTMGHPRPTTYYP